MNICDQERGVLERIIYFNDETHYCIGEFRCSGASASITIAGALPGVQCGETLVIEGAWSLHPTHGRQFKVSKFKSELPSSVYGIRKYLGSGLIDGIGKGYANKIVDHFGQDTLDIISHESARLKEVPGIGAQRAKSIKLAWDSQMALRDVFMFLKTYGVGTATCLRIVRQYGETAKAILQENPYRVAREIKGIGFKTADKIALNLGFPNDGDARIDAGILFAMADLEDAGHTAATLDILLECAVELLQVDITLVSSRVDGLIAEKSLILEHDLYQLPITFRRECDMVQKVQGILSAPSELPEIKVDKAIKWAQERAGFDFAPEQSQAIEMALTSKFSILTGGPGTGKTTILRALVDILKAKKTRITLAAPTGRAAQRMSSTARSYAQTIHRLLQVDKKKGGFLMREDNPIKADFIIVDESSMLDTSLASSLFKAIADTTHVLLVGDVDQLPSVGPGNVLKDWMQSGWANVTKLNTIFRQKARSAIVMVAHNILKGALGVPYHCQGVDELEKKSDFCFIKANDDTKCLDAINRLIFDWIPQNYPHVNPLIDTQILAPMHKGSAGIGMINQKLQERIQGKKPSVSFGGRKYSVGDKVIQSRNNYDKNIFNGDIGRVDSIDTESGTLSVMFDSGPVDLERNDLADISLAYAISIHKSQGSEFPFVIIPLLKQHFIMLQRNLIYTAITRGRKKVFLVGDPVAYAMAINNVDTTQRKTAIIPKVGGVIT